MVTKNILYISYVSNTQKPRSASSISLPKTHIHHFMLFVHNCNLLSPPFTNFLAISSLAYDTIIGCTIGITFIVASSSTIEISPNVEGEFNPFAYKPLVDDMQKTEREYLLELQVFQYYEPPFIPFNAIL